MTRIGVYVINLDRSPERWQTISTHARRCGITLIRVSACDASCISTEDYIGVDRRAFLRHGARHLLPGEYGCYRSHLACLSAFLESSFDAAVIMEDDVLPCRDLTDRVRALLSAAPNVHLVKLFNHRTIGFVRRGVSSLGDEIGQCIHGPQGSAACYVVTRHGARRLFQDLSRMCFPYDVALERGWAHGIRAYSVRANLVTFGPASRLSGIATRKQYNNQKIGGFPRILTHLDRCVEYVRRIAHVVSGERRRELVPPPL